MVVNDNTEEVKASLEAAVQRGLEAVGLQAEGYAKMKSPVDTGNLRNSISHAVEDHTAYIGTNVEYAPYVEYGTSKMAARPYLRPAASEHSAEYSAIFRTYLSQG